VGGVFPPTSLRFQELRLPSRLFLFYETLLADGRTRTSKNQTSFINFSPPPQYKKDFFIYDFCEGEDARCLANFAASKMRQTRRSRSILSYNHQGRRPRRPTSEPRPPQAGRTVPTPLTQPAGADVQEAEAGGAFNHQISGILYIVKPV